MIQLTVQGEVCKKSLNYENIKSLKTEDQVVNGRNWYKYYISK